MKKKYLFVLAFFICISSHSANYYASPTGSSSGLSSAQPAAFTSIVNKLQAGDTLFMLSGQYDLQTTILKLVGSKNKEIVIISYDEPYSAILDFRKTAYGKRGLQLDKTCQYVHIKGLTLRYSGKNALYNEGSFCTFEQLDVYGNGDTGVQMKVNGNNTIINVDSHHNFDYETLTSTGDANYGGNADGFADKQHGGAANTYIGCRAWANSDDGWDFFQRTVSSGQNTLSQCITFQNGPASYNMKNHPRYETDKSFFDGLIGTQVTDRYGNIITVTLEQFPNIGNGNGFKMGGGNTENPILLEHCLAVGNTVRGFDQNNNIGKMIIYNCSAYMNGTDYGFHNSNGTLTIRNCLSYKSIGNNEFKVSSLINDHNSWNIKNLTIENSDFLSLDTTLILSTRVYDGSLPEVSFMRLKEGSKLIDQGIDVNLTYSGTAPDLGCYEFDSGNIVTPPEPEPEIEPDENDINVAFVSLISDSRDKLILDKLNQNEHFKVFVRDATEDNDYSAFSLIVLSPVPNSTAAGLQKLKTIDKPMLVLKPFMFKSTVWNWGNAFNTQEHSISITEPRHIIFKDITISDSNELSLFTDEATGNAVTGINEWYNTSVSTIATPVQAQGETLVEIASGTNINGTTSKADILMLGISEYSTSMLTPQATQLIDNCCMYLLGLLKDDNTATATILKCQDGNTPVYNIMGIKVAEDPSYITTLPHGIYIIGKQKIVR